MTKVWNMIQKIRGKNSKSSVHHLKAEDHMVTDKTDIANKLTETIAKNSSSDKYVPQFQRYRKEEN